MVVFVMGLGISLVIGVGISYDVYQKRKGYGKAEENMREWQRNEGAGMKASDARNQDVF